MWNALAIIAPILALLIFDGYWDGAIIGWADAHEGLAAWVQAFGAIAAISWGIWLWRRDRADHARDRTSRAAVLAYRLYPFFIDIEKAFEIQMKAVEIFKEKMSGDQAANVILAARKSLLFPVYPDPAIFSEFQYMPPNLARRISHVMYGLERNRRMMESSLDLAEKAPANLPSLMERQKTRLATLRADFDAVHKEFAAQYRQEFEPGSRQ